MPEKARDKFVIKSIVGIFHPNGSLIGQVLSTGKRSILANYDDRFVIEDSETGVEIMQFPTDTEYYKAFDEATMKVIAGIIDRRLIAAHVQAPVPPPIAPKAEMITANILPPNPPDYNANKI